MIIGQRGFPQSSFAPLHWRHMLAGGLSVTSTDLAASSSMSMACAGITFESQAILRGRGIRKVQVRVFLKVVVREQTRP
jgi:hypothetical protein